MYRFRHAIATAMALAAVAVGGVVVAMGVAAPAEEKAPDAPGVALIEMRGPDGKLLASTDVEVNFEGRQVSAADHIRQAMEREREATAAAEAARAGLPPPAPHKEPLENSLQGSLRTDGKGILSVPWPTGACRCRVEVKGVGFGVTGSVEILSGAAVKVHLPPLASREAIPHYAGLPSRKAFEPAWATMPPPGAAQFPVELMQETVLAGKVVDMQGRPIEGAVVLTDGEYVEGIIRKTSTTDKDGQYHIPIERLRGSILHLVVCANVKDRPPAFALMPRPTADGSAGAAGAKAPSGSCDIIVPDKGASLDVEVLSEGKPAEHAMVQLQPADRGLFLSLGGWSRAGPSDVEKLICPTAMTDAGGVARFDNLLPGPYNVTAIDGGAEGDVARLSPGWRVIVGTDKPYGEATGVLVAPGERRRATVSVEARKASILMRAFSPDGRLVMERTVDLMFTQAGVAGAGGASTGVTMDKVGLAKFNFPNFGLWRLRVRFLDTSFSFSPLRDGPFYEAEAVLAVSPNMPPEPTINFYATAKSGGTIDVTLQDLDGKPVRGTVALAATLQNQNAYAGTTDDAGHIVFTDLPVLTMDGYYVCAYANLEPPHAAILTRADKELEGAVAFPVKYVAVKFNETKLTVREERLGYVRGKVKPADGVDPAKLELALEGEGRPEVQSGVAFDAKTGEFLAGPFLPGKTTLRLGYQGAEGPLDAGRSILEVTGGKVTHTDISPLPKAEQRSVWPYAGEASVSGQVVLADGKTPVWAARVMRVARGVRRPHSLGWTDAAGRFETWRQGAYGAADYGQADPPGSPAEDVVIAWLPGQCGAAVVPAGKGTDLRLVLPRAMKAEGRVTVGGKAASAARGVIHLLARHEGLGKLDEWMEIATTANGDGSFALTGLSPGAYTVQAALDDIWLSDSVHVTVGDKDLDPIRLDVPGPGASVVVKIEQAGGRPLAETDLTVALPPGPLTDRLRPLSLRTDAAGRVLLAGLPAGPNRLSVAGAKGEFKVAIPAAGEAAPAELSVQIGKE